MGQATGIYDLMRNIGAGIGISLMTTFLARSTRGPPGSARDAPDAVRPALSGNGCRARHASALAARGSVFTAPMQALALLYRVVLRQATLLAFLDNFQMISVAAVVCLPLVLLFRRSRVSVRR